MRLPDSLGNLKKLKVLQLDNNQIQQLPDALLSGCTSLHTLSLHDNPITPQQLESTPGFEAYNARRRGKYDKGISGGALLNSNGLDEGVDRLLK
jgi:Leucine-rich repeat (LRR) protein